MVNSTSNLLLGRTTPLPGFENLAAFRPFAILCQTKHIYIYTYIYEYSIEKVNTQGFARIRRRDPRTVGREEDKNEE